jgi:hypothetical protein
MDYFYFFLYYKYLIMVSKNLRLVLLASAVMFVSNSLAKSSSVVELKLRELASSYQPE